MEVESKCFVCQSKISKSESQSADRSSSEKRRKRTKIDNNCNNLDSSTWRTFCHYFYPPPLVSLVDSSSTNCPENKIEFFSRPVFCGVCRQTILNLCNLHNLLESVQSKISKLVAQVALTFVQEEEDNHDNENEERNNSWMFDGLSPSQLKRKKKEHQDCDDNVIYSMRRTIRQRYQPLVCIARSNLDIQNQSIGGGGSINDFEAGELSPLSIHSFDLNQALDFDDLDLSRPIKQEVEDFFHDGDIDNVELQNLNQTSDLPAENTKKETKIQKQTTPKAKNRNKSVESSEDEDDEDVSDYSEDEDSESDSDYEPQSKSSRKKVSSPKSKTKLTSPRQPKPKVAVKAKEKADENSSDDDHDKKTMAKTSSKSTAGKTNNIEIKKIGKNLYEFRDKWRYESRRSGQGRPRLHCLSCPQVLNKSFSGRSCLITHIRKWHIKEPSLRVNIRKTEKLDENTFLYDDKYTVKKVTESNGVFYKCDVCSFLAKTFTHMRNHLKEQHIEGRRYVCEICGYSAVRSDYLKSHMNSHEQDKKFICEECGKQFKTKAALTGHSGVHSGKMYECQCGLKFTYLSNLGLHRKQANHPDLKKVPTPDVPCVAQTCQLCKKEFVSPEYFRKHVLECKAKEKLPCDWCGRIYVRKATINYHKIHNCTERFKFNKLLGGQLESASGKESPVNVEDKLDGEDE